MSFIEQPLDGFLGFTYERVSSSRVNVRLTLQPLHMNSVGVVHGGIISTLADVAMSNLVESDEGVQRAVTIDLHTTYLQPARGHQLVAEAQVAKQGKTLLYADCLVYDDEWQLVAKSSGTFFMRAATFVPEPTL
ncbi:PaaI family thioesterase [Alicyclobacillus sp. ALC3]|uniref:PaaI family thioesterase n=1 Tax=Alicyclobacillus sp. ALC3 TaxID=2796143 RepID=UPI002379FB75|nr:PaaI family thioesterase [Alicyclobacillus sp. ALC3]WDL96425.1 PaaI family thioesterase [Alicyclobacillus sp. ALC3]